MNFLPIIANGGLGFAFLKTFVVSFHLKQMSVPIKFPKWPDTGSGLVTTSRSYSAMREKSVGYFTVHLG